MIRPAALVVFGAMEDRRRILVHAFAILTLAFALGLVAGPLGQQGHAHARLWLGAHITGITIGTLLIGVGLVRPHLHLGAMASRVFFLAAVGGNWVGMLVLGIYASAIGAGTPIVTPNLPPPHGVHAAVIVSALVVVTVTTFVMCGLALWGLRKSAAGGSLSPSA